VVRKGRGGDGRERGEEDRRQKKGPSRRRIGSERKGERIKSELAVIGREVEDKGRG